MRRSKFTEGQMAYALKQAELGISVEEVCRKTGISSVFTQPRCKAGPDLLLNRLHNIA